MIDKGVLLANLPFFDRNYLVHKEMQSGMGYKVKRSGDLNKKRKVLPICDLLYGAAILKKNNSSTRFLFYIILIIARI